MKKAIEFEIHEETGEPILHPIGRLVLASGNVARLFLGPDGVRILVDKASIENGDIHLMEMHSVMGLGKITERNEI